MGGFPWFKFFPADWVSDPDLRRCNHTEKGVLIDLLCALWDAETPGVAATNGRAWDDQEIAFALGGDTKTVAKAIKKMEARGVLRRDENGALYSSRMRRDGVEKSKRMKAGKRAAGARWAKNDESASKSHMRNGCETDASASKSHRDRICETDASASKSHPNRIDSAHAESESDTESDKKKKARSAAPPPPLVGGDGFDPSGEYGELWGRWMQARKENRHGYPKAAQLDSLARQFAGWGWDETRERIELAIVNGWRGLKFPGDDAKFGKGNAKGVVEDPLEAMLAKPSEVSP